MWRDAHSCEGLKLDSGLGNYPAREPQPINVSGSWSPWRRVDELVSATSSPAVGDPGRLREAVEGSLRRLRLERIDLNQLARIDPTVPATDQFGALAELRQQGKIRHVGLSEVGVDQVQAARKIVPVASVQNRYSLADRAWEPVVDHCQHEGLAFLPWFPLGAGSLVEAGGALVEVARRHHATAAQVALAWLLRRSPVMLPIPGTSSVAHLEENLAASALRLHDDEFHLLASM